MKLKVLHSVFVHLVFLVIVGHCYGDKLRVCVVDGRGGFKRATKYCPILDRIESKVECVVGIDRLDCLRRISKGKVDFAVFTPEDLVTATNSEIEVLLTNQMKFTDTPYEYEIVAITSDDSGIESKHDLRDKKFCHPGYGYETDWTNILANYLEATVIPQSCESQLTLTENRIKSSSSFFKAACKAGPWVNDPTMDAQLKGKYRNLCELCEVPSRCSMSDKYWGRRGPLFCLTDGVGDVSWARLDDAKIHFGLAPGSTAVSPEGYSFLCKDGTRMPVNSTKTPCTWVAKPWPVIAARKKKAAEIQQFLTSFTSNTANDWQRALLSLIQKYKQKMVPLDPIQPIESYMLEAPGFLSANSFTGCHPPRTVRMCTTSILENAKCAWMREAAAVYGVEPDVDCIKADNVTHCMEAVSYGVADVLLVTPDYVNFSRKKYNLKTLVYETTTNDYKYITVAIVKKDSKYTRLEDLRGATACFPSYDGIAWNSALHALSNRSLLTSCPPEVGFVDFFSNVVASRLPKGHSHKHIKEVTGDEFEGDYGVIRCLNQGLGDVGFLSMNNFEKFFRDPREVSYNIDRENFRTLCPHDERPCHLSWSPLGQLMTSSNKSDLWVKDTVDVFLQMDNLFGKFYKSVTVPFTMFDIFDGKSNVLFHDNTIKLRTVPRDKHPDTMIREYEDILNSKLRCSGALSFNITNNIHLIVFLAISITFRYLL